MYTPFHIEMPDPSEEPDPQFQTTLITSLTVYNTSKKSKSKSKAAEKIVKVKEIDFTVTENNYLEILTKILKSHSQEKYKVTARKHYGFKYIYPPSKAYVTYKFEYAVVWLPADALQCPWRCWRWQREGLPTNGKKILEAKPKKVKVIIDIKDVQCSCRVVSHQ